MQKREKNLKFFSEPKAIFGFCPPLGGGGPGKKTTHPRGGGGVFTPPKKKYAPGTSAKNFFGAQRPKFPCNGGKHLEKFSNCTQRQICSGVSRWGNGWSPDPPPLSEGFP